MRTRRVCPSAPYFVWLANRKLCDPPWKKRERNSTCTHVPSAYSTAASWRSREVSAFLKMVRLEVTAVEIPPRNSSRRVRRDRYGLGRGFSRETRSLRDDSWIIYRTRAFLVFSYDFIYCLFFTEITPFAKFRNLESARDAREIHERLNLRKRWTLFSFEWR